MVGDLCLAQALEALGGEAYETAALVRRVRCTFDESGIGQPVDGAGDAAWGEIAAFAELSDRHRSAWYADQRNERAAAWSELATVKPLTPGCCRLLQSRHRPSHVRGTSALRVLLTAYGGRR